MTWNTRATGSSASTSTPARRRSASTSRWTIVGATPIGHRSGGRGDGALGRGPQGDPRRGGARRGRGRRARNARAGGHGGGAASAQGRGEARAPRCGGRRGDLSSTFSPIRGHEGESARSGTRLDVFRSRSLRPVAARMPALPGTAPHDSSVEAKLRRTGAFSDPCRGRGTVEATGWRAGGRIPAPARSSPLRGATARTGSGSRSAPAGRAPPRRVRRFRPRAARCTR